MRSVRRENSGRPEAARSGLVSNVRPPAASGGARSASPEGGGRWAGFARSSTEPRQGAARVILHTDINSAYASMERVFNPKLRSRPVCILSNNDGCIVALTKDAKALGIKRGTPYFKVRALCEKKGVAVLSSNYELYDAMSRRFHRVVAGFGPVHEAYSIDEAFLDLTGMPEAPEAIGRAMKARVAQWLGLPVCVGIGPTKTLAKLCDHFAKTYPVFGGVVDWFSLSPERRERALSITPVREIWGVGPRTGEKLGAMGVRTALDFARMDASLVRARFGVVLERTLREIRGVACIPLEEKPVPKQQILRSRSFPAATDEKRAVLAAVSTHMAEVARQLRREGSVARTAGVFFHTDPFKEDSPWFSAAPQMRLVVPSADTLLLTHAACDLVERYWREGCRIKKAGAFATDLSGENEPVEAESLFDVVDEEAIAARKRLMTCLDELASRYGKNIWRVGSAAGADGWQMRRDRLTPQYLTNWADIPKVG